MEILIIIIIIIWSAIFLERFNYIFLVKKKFENNRINIDNSMIKRLDLMSLRFRKNEKNNIVYAIKYYLTEERDLFLFKILVFIIVILFMGILSIRSLISEPENFLPVVKIILIYSGVIYIIVEVVHHIVYRKKRVSTDCLIVLLRAILKLSNECNVKCDGFIGTLLISNSSIVFLTQGRRKKNINYNWYDFTDIPKVKCNYKENTVVATVETKDGTYTREFSKFIFESDQVEKDYFKALYEFPFMERSTVYDFERLHHDIMQDLVDEERTFYFKDYLIKEEAS